MRTGAPLLGQRHYSEIGSESQPEATSRQKPVMRFAKPPPHEYLPASIMEVPMRTLVFALVIQIAALTGCATGPSTTGPALPEASKAAIGSPDAVGKALLAAASANDFKAMTALYPSEALLRASMACQDPNWIPMVVKVMHTKKDQFINALKTALVGFSLTWVSSKKLAAKTFNAGDENKGCKYLVPVKMEQHAWTFELKKGEKARNNTGEVVLWYFEKYGWFLVKF